MFEVNAPEGASQDQVLEYAKSQWGKQQAKPAPVAKPPVEDPGFLRSMQIGTGKTFDSLLDGMTQMYLGARGETSALGGLKQNVEEKTAPYKRLQEVRPYSTGIGEAIPSMVVPMGAGASTLSTAGRMALAGGLPAALEYGTPEERLRRGALAAAGSAAVPLAVAGFKTGKSLLEPLYEGGRKTIAARTLNRVAGDEAGNVAARLQAAQPLVPGSMPTAAQVAENGGIAALERAAMSSNPTPFTQRAMEQSSARLSALRGIAGDDATMKAAIEARDGAAEALYGRAFDSDTMRRGLVVEQEAAARSLNGVGGNVHVDALDTPGLRDLMQRPMFQKAAQVAKNLAADNGVALDDPTKSLQGLHYIKLALDDMSEATATNALGRNAMAAAGGMKAKLADELAKVAPLYGNARSTYADMSRPINQMEVGQELLKKVEPAMADFGGLGRETGATFAKALREADVTAARATGYKGAKMSDVMTPDQMSTMRAVAEDLARKSNAQTLGGPVGSNSFQNFAMDNIAAQSGMPRAVGGLLSLPGVNRATNWLYRDTDQKVKGLLADSLLNPAAAGKMMSEADRKLLEKYPAMRRLLEESAVRGGGLLGLSLVD